MSVDDARARMCMAAFRRAAPALQLPNMTPLREREAIRVRDAFARLGLDLAKAPSLATDVDYALIAGASFVIENLVRNIGTHTHPTAESQIRCVIDGAEDLMALLLVATGCIFGRGDNYDEARAAGERDVLLAEAAAALDDSVLDADPENGL